MKEGSLEEAQDAFIDAIELYTPDQRNYSNIGVIYLQQEDTEKGVEWFSKAIEVNPQHVRGYLNLITSVIQSPHLQQITLLPQ